MSMRAKFKIACAVFLLICFAAIALLVTVSSAAGPVVRTYFINTADATLAWDEVANSDLAGFRLYTQPVSSITVIKTEIAGADKRQFVWVDFPSGQFLAWMTAYDKYNNESDPSETIQVNKSTTKPAIPTNNRVVGATVVINMP